MLLHKPRKKDSWQLPQGGVEDGEDYQQAALRELKEEAGIDAKLIGKSENVYKYDFPPSYRRFRPDKVCGQRIEFSFGIVETDTEVQVDQREIDKFVWINPDQLGKYIKRKKYADFIRGLVEEGVGILGINAKYCGKNSKPN